MSINAAENTVSLELIEELLITRFRNDLVKHHGNYSYEANWIPLLDYFDVCFIELIKCLKDQKDSISLDDVYIFLSDLVSLDYATHASPKFTNLEVYELLKKIETIYCKDCCGEYFIIVDLAADYVKNKTEEANKAILELNANFEDSQTNSFELLDSISKESKGKYRKRIILIDEYLKEYFSDCINSSDIPWFHIEAYLNCIITHNKPWAEKFLKYFCIYPNYNTELYFLLSKLKELFGAI